MSTNSGGRVEGPESYLFTTEELRIKGVENGQTPKSSQENCTEKKRGGRPGKRG